MIIETFDRTPAAVSISSGIQQAVVDKVTNEWRYDSRLVSMQRDAILNICCNNGCHSTFSCWMAEHFMISYNILLQYCRSLGF